VSHPWHDLPAGPNPPAEISVVVEIPKGSRNKYELDKASGLFRLDRVLYSAVHYPGDYGFIPQTYYEDGDPLDALVIVSEPSFPGCRIDARPVGLFEMRDPEVLDVKVLAVPLRDPLYEQVRRLDDVPAHFLREVEHFFAIYKELEGVHTQALGWRGGEEARDVIAASLRRYDREIRPGRPGAARG
jgi:inorganic pyrophosphatase